MKKSRLLIDVGFTSILTCILFSLVLTLIYPFLTKGQYLSESGVTMVWYFMMTLLPVMLILAPLHYVFLKLGQWAGPLLIIIIATITVSVIRVDVEATLYMMFSPFLLITPIFCMLSWLLHRFMMRFQGVEEIRPSQ